MFISIPVICDSSSTPLGRNHNPEDHSVHVVEQAFRRQLRFQRYNEDTVDVIIDLNRIESLSPVMEEFRGDDKIEYAILKTHSSEIYFIKKTDYDNVKDRLFNSATSALSSLKDIYRMIEEHTNRLVHERLNGKYNAEADRTVMESMLIGIQQDVSAIIDKLEER